MDNHFAPPRRTLTPVFSLAPARNALVAMAATPPAAPEDLLAHRVVFERFAGTLAAIDAPLDADLPAFLPALAQTPPAHFRAHGSAPAGLDPEVAAAAKPLTDDAAALRRHLVEALSKRWAALAPEWPRTLAAQRPALAALAQTHGALNAPALEVARTVLRRRLPEPACAALADARALVFIPSPRVELLVADFGTGERAQTCVFFRFETDMLRLAAIRTAELLGPLSALADDTRLRLLEALAEGEERSAQELIDDLQVSQPNVSRHLKQLVGAGLVEERRAGGAAKRYRLRPEGVRAALFKVELALDPANARAARAQARQASARAAALEPYPRTLRPFLDEQGRVTHFSTRLGEQQAVLAYLLGKIAPGRDYAEKEITALIASWIAPGQGRFGIDAVTLRRALIEEGGLRRTPTGSKYWVETIA
ncbi:MAG: metalloregulator ArsR/SmtB family transcription factor [Thermoflexales bacterium]|nr:metalloregulator ArsR/SmtB family transcription factor [Thermoflexales bacterium]